MSRERFDGDSRRDNRGNSRGNNRNSGRNYGREPASHPQSRQDKVDNFVLNMNRFDDEFPLQDYSDNTSGEIDITKLDREISSAGERRKAPSDRENLESFSGEEQRERMVQQERKEQKRHKKNRKIRKKEKAQRYGCMFKFVWLSLVVIVGVILGQFFMRGANDLLAINRQEDLSMSVTINEDDTIDEVAQKLQDAGIIHESFFFKIYATITKSEGTLIAGDYNLDTNLDYEALINRLQVDTTEREVVTVQLTEGLSIKEYAKILEDEGVCESAEFLELCNSDKFDDDYSFLEEIPNNDRIVYKLEGYLFPDTYTFYKDASPTSVISKMLSNFNRKCLYTKSKYEGFEETMTIKAAAEAKGMTLHELVTLSSLIQGEAADEEDMYNVSSVFHNRLDTIASGGMNSSGEGELNRLKSDVARYYPYESKDDVPKDIRDTFISAYDTYEIIGYPPGGVCSPGLNALKAAITPNDTNYYFFCHRVATEDQEAEAFYAETNAGHEANLIKAGIVEG